MGGDPVALTRGIEHRQGYPACLGGGHGARQHGTRIAVEDQAPPAVALQGKIHHPSVDEPVLVRHARLEGMRLGRNFGGVLPRGPWDIRIDLAVERHNSFHGAHRQIRFAAQTPDPKASGIGMALLEMINSSITGSHTLRAGVCGAGSCPRGWPHVALEARNPRVDRAGDLQTLTDTALTPALRIEGDDLQAGLGALGMAVVVEQRPGWGVAEGGGPRGVAPFDQ